MAGSIIRELQRGGTPLNTKSVTSTDFCRARFRDPKTKTDWRIYFRVDDDAIVIVEIVAKKTQHIPKDVMQRCKKRLRDLDKDE